MLRFCALLLGALAATTLAWAPPAPPPLRSPKLNYAKFVRVGDAGHFVMLDQPPTFAAAVAEFLK